MPYPLRATYDRSGVNFALASEGATAVELCLFGEVEGVQEVKSKNVRPDPQSQLCCSQVPEYRLYEFCI
jgi:pullulanase/glycogen debranching enzyme